MTVDNPEDNPVDNENISKESQSTSAMHCSGVLILNNSVFF